MNFLNKVSNFLGKYFIAVVFLTTLVAMLLPQIFIPIGKVKIFNQSLVTIGLGLIMFVMGVTLNEKDFKIVVTRPKDIFVGCLAQFTIMPLTAYVLAKIFNLPPELAIGLILLGTCPGGTASNVMTYLAKGDLALSVGMTTISTLLASFLTPVLTFILAKQWIKIDMVVMLMDIVKVVIIPIFSGILIHKIFGEKIQKISNILVIIPILCILTIMGMCISPNRTSLINSGLILVLAVCLHNWFGFLLGWGIGEVTGMNSSKKKAVSIEVGLQNSGLAIGLSSQFNNPLCALPATVAIVVHQVSGSILVGLFSKGISIRQVYYKNKRIEI